MWTTIYVAMGRENAFEIGEKLKAEGFLIKVEFFTKEGTEEVYEIIGPEFEVDDIRDAMMELGII